jgi:hypothetical protein
MVIKVIPPFFTEVENCALTALEEACLELTFSVTIFRKYSELALSYSSFLEV